MKTKVMLSKCARGKLLFIKRVKKTNLVVDDMWENKRDTREPGMKLSPATFLKLIYSLSFSDELLKKCWVLPSLT